MSSVVESRRDLLAWQRGVAMTEAVYRLSRRYPKDELFGLARGSPQELERHLLIAARVALTDRAAVAPVLSKADEIGRMLGKPIQTLTATGD